MRKIVTFAHDDVGQASRIDAAINISTVVGGHATIVGVPGIRDGATEAERFEALRTASQSRAQVERQLRAAGHTWTWREGKRDAALAVGSESCLAELIVLNRYIDEYTGIEMSSLAGRLAVSTRRPILAVPMNEENFVPSGLALIAWDGSACADAALRASVPLLKHAQAITILEIKDGANESSAQLAKAYLELYDLSPMVVEQAAEDQGVARTILEAVRDKSPAFVVMGGYGRSRLSEVIFGGVTRLMLTHSPAPLFLVHAA